MRRLPLRSPPRMRGKVWLHQKPGRVPGITPAYAGKRASQLCAGLAPRDHPRVCGEKARTLIVQDEPQGSPPRMRGKVHCPRSRLGRTRDHPRVCGEKMNQSSSHRWVTGSPPRMRGKVSGQKLWMVLCGITPAYAGKRSTATKYFQQIRDHPRVCGEKCSSKLFVKELSGSPPRMRGKVNAIFPPPGQPGITPAYAGKSPSCQVIY